MAPRRIAVGSKKGGPGKTSVSVRLAEALVRAGERVLVIDLDSQANATTLLEVNGEYNLFDVLFAGKPGALVQAIYPSTFPGIDVVPASASLARIVSESLMAAEMRLRTAAHGADELNVYDTIIIDLPPAVDRLTLNGLIYADYAVAIAEPTSFGLDGVRKFVELVDEVRSLPHLNPDLQMAGIIVNKYNSMTTEHPAGVQDLLRAYGDLVLQPYIPLRTAMQQAESRRIPLTDLPGVGSAVLVQKFDLLVKNLRERI